MQLHKPGVKLFKPPLNPFHTTTDTVYTSGFHPTSSYSPSQATSGGNTQPDTNDFSGTGTRKRSRFPFPETPGGMYAGQC